MRDGRSLYPSGARSRLLCGAGGVVCLLMPLLLVTSYPGTAGAQVSCDWDLWFEVGTIDCERPNVVFDDFSDWEYRTPWYPGDPLDAEGEPYWWNVLNGVFGGEYNVECSTMGTECLWHETEGRNGFMRLEVSPFGPFSYEGEYHDVSITEENHGFGYLEERRWEPDPGRPVIVHARVRWPEHYAADGSGEFIGSSGIYLWNYPADYAEGTFHEVRSIGLDILSDDSLIEERVGLGVTATYQQYPFVYTPDVFVCSERYFDVDVSDWFTFTMVWSENRRGEQTVRFWIDGHPLQRCDLPVAFPELGLEAWVDNYVIVPWEDGMLWVTTGEISETQHFDVDYLGAYQPNVSIPDRLLTNLGYLESFFD